MYSSEHFTCFQDVEESREGLMSVSLEVDVTRLPYSSPAGRTMLPPLTRFLAQVLVVGVKESRLVPNSQEKDKSDQPALPATYGQTWVMPEKEKSARASLNPT